MKKTLCFSLSLLFTMLILLTGCSNTDDTSVNPPTRAEVGELELLPAYTSTLYGATSENGYYHWEAYLAESEDGSFDMNGSYYNLIFTDFATQKSSVMCNIADCAHDNDVCSAYLSYKMGTPKMFILNNMLYLQYNKAADVGTDTILTPTKLEVRDLENTTSTTLTTFPNDIYIDMPFAYDNANNCLYGVYTTYTNYPNESIYCLYALDLNSGEITTIKQFEEGYSSVTLTGVIGNNLILAPAKTLFLEDGSSNSISEYGTYSINDDELFIFKTLDKDNPGSVFKGSFSNSYFYYTIDTTVIRVDMTTGEEKTIFTSDLDGERPTSMLFSYPGEKLQIITSVGTPAGRTFSYHLYDSAADTLTEFTPIFDHAVGINDPISIIGETADYYVIELNMAQYQEDCYRFAIISKSDYEATQENYIYFPIYQ